MEAKGQLTEACIVQTDAAPKEVQDLKYLYCNDEDCSQSRTCQCLNAKLTCTELCSYNCDHCPKIAHSLFLTDSSGHGNKINTELLFSIGLSCNEMIRKLHKNTNLIYVYVYCDTTVYVYECIPYVVLTI